MRSYILKRLAALILILLGASFITFGLMHLAGGNAVTYLYENTGTAVSADVILAREQELGINEPFLVQYGKWLVQLLQGNLGFSFISDEPVSALILEKLPHTLLLAGVSLAVTILVSVPLGICAAVKKSKVADLLIRAVSFVGNSVPGFFIALVFIYLFYVRWNFWNPAAHENLAAFIGAVCSLAIPMSAKYIRQVRSLILDELARPYVEASLVQGVRAHTVLFHNVLKAVLVPLVTLFSLSLGSLLGGTAIIETIFMYDGVGKLAVDAMMMRDYPVIQGYVLWMAAIYTVLNFFCDLAYMKLDPRIRKEGARDE